MTSDDASLLARARTHAALRWAGIATALVAVPTLLVTLWAAISGVGVWKLVAVGVFACGLSLGAFGANNDTCLHAAHILDERGVSLPAELAAELAHERRVRPERLLALHGTPTVGFVLPVVADLLVLFLAWRAASALGWIGAVN